MSLKKLYNSIKATQEKPKRTILPETFEKVQKEFYALTIGRDILTTEEILNLRKYAKAKTRLDADEDLLTDEQLAWKVWHSTLDEQLDKSLGAEKKSDIDKSLNEMDFLTMYGKLLKEYITLCNTINELFNKQVEYVQTHFSDTSKYREKEESYGKLMVNPDQSNEDHLKYSNLILELSKTYRDELVEPLSKITNQLQEKILELEKQEQYFSIHPDNRELLDCFKEEFFNNIVVVNHIKSSSDWDEAIPNSVIENNGKLGTFPTSFAEQMAKTVALSREAGQKISVLEARRRGLTEKYVGKS